MARKRNYLAAGPCDRDGVKARLVIIVSRANNERHRGRSDARAEQLTHSHTHTQPLMLREFENRCRCT